METNELFEKITNSGNTVIYHYIRGSHAYGTNTDTSDIDTGIVYISPVTNLLDLGYGYKEQMQSSKGDDSAYELNRFFHLLMKSNPTVMEALFIPERCILYEHPIMTEIKKHRDLFITKECFRPIIGYSYEQIRKCRGLNKRFLQENIQRKTILDFVYTFHNQGSTSINNYLESHGLKQRYCGLVNVPNMPNNYSLFYDWGNHILNENVNLDDLVELTKIYNPNHPLSNFYETLMLYNGLYSQWGVNNEKNLREFFENCKPIGYKGLTNEDETSTELRLSSVEKNIQPLCYISYNMQGFICHCADYKAQKTWEKERNPERYKENCGKMFDRKNVAHSVRLLHMGIELAKGEGFNVDRTNIDRDFILNIRQGNTSYEEIISYLEEKKNEMDEIMEGSTIREKIDVEKVNELLLGIRKKQLRNTLW